MKEPFIWDHYSNQPHQLKDRVFKKRMRRHNLGSLIFTVLISLMMLPVSLLLMPFLRRREIDTSHFFGMSVNLDSEPDLTPQLIEELGVKSLLIRLPLWEMDRLDEYVDFIKQFKTKKLLINVMQDREHIEDAALFKEHISLIFERLAPFSKTFQIGTTINRAKWGFFSVNEYLNFYKIAYDVKKHHYPELKLIGPSVIDFEYHFTAHALFNLSSIRFDALSALLYVDRRGAPENTQMGFDLIRKINFLASMAVLSSKSSSILYLTETNWPLTRTAPYAPTSEFECIDEKEYADFMVRYYLLSFATQKVDAVFWHQLIAPGYGLIDNRDGIRKRSAFLAFKTMLTHLKDTRFINFFVSDNFYTLTCENHYGHFDVLWSPHHTKMIEHNYVKIVAQDGSKLQEREPISISSSVIYAYDNYKGNL